MVAEVTHSPSSTNLATLWSINPSDEIVFSKNSQGDLAAKVQIKNISAKSIAFKVPNCYKSLLSNKSIFIVRGCKGIKERALWWLCQQASFVSSKVKFFLL